MRTILITGSSGFVGEELLIKLSDENNKIIGIDNFEPSQELKNKKIKNFFFEKTEIRNNQKKLDEIFKKYKPEIIIHCASKILDTTKKKGCLGHQLFCIKRFV